MDKTDKYRARLIDLLKSLFQLDQPELDFGFYRIMHARSERVLRFLEKDLLAEIAHAFGAFDGERLAQAQAAYDTAIEQARKFGAPDPEQTDAAREAREALLRVQERGGAEGEIYDHLYRFFERYYDGGDFLSRRYYARETDGRAAPYAVPYDGREVYLHWANKDQYYIKTSEHLTNFTFDLGEAVRKEQAAQGQLHPQTAMRFDTEPATTRRLVHCRIVAAAEGPHGNVKAAADQRRYFLVHAPAPAVFAPDPAEPDAPAQLVLQFEYRSDPDKTGQDAKWQQTRLEEAAAAILAVLVKLPQARPWLEDLRRPAPTDKQTDRTLLLKYLQRYAARNTVDYFIHKDLGGFLRRELDFYIKNEIMRLDDIESLDAPRVESYLSRIRVLRRIAHKLIDFLAQAEEFQKRLWLKKKFVTEVHWCMTLDLVPEAFYPEIIANKRQHEEWVRLGFFSEDTEITPALLSRSPFLALDTRHFRSDQTDFIVSGISGMDALCSGYAFHAENSLALRLLHPFASSRIRCSFADPPYNTGNDGFLYKDAYRHATWMTAISDSLAQARSLLAEDGALILTIDDEEVSHLRMVLEDVFAQENFVANAIWHKKYARQNDATWFSTSHDHVIVIARNKHLWRPNRIPRNEQQDKSYKNPDNDPRGSWQSVVYTCNKTADERPNLYYPIIHPKTGQEVWPARNRVWAFERSKHEENTREGKLWWGLDQEKDKPRLKVFLQDLSAGMIPSTLWTRADAGDNQDAQRALAELFNGNCNFSTPKPVQLVVFAMQIGADSGPAFLSDFYAGSGTTAHAIINLNREDGGNRKYILVEMGDYFDTVLLPRIKKVVYARDWKDGRPKPDKDGNLHGISHCFKYLRLESYEDALNNLSIREDPVRERALDENPDLREDYYLRYWLDLETRGSASLLNIERFADPTAYRMKIKRPGSEETEWKAVDLIETFNWLIGLHVEHMDRPRTYDAQFARIPDPELPEEAQDQTRLRVAAGSLKERADGSGRFWLRKIEGWTARTPGATPECGDTDRVLVLWRKLTGDLEQDNAVLDAWLARLRLEPRDNEFDCIYVNGSNNLSAAGSARTRVRLLEETFHRRMWEIDEP